jgi:hypothetical protein
VASVGQLPRINLPRRLAKSHQTRGMSRYLTFRAYSSYPASPLSSIPSSRGILQTNRPRVHYAEAFQRAMPQVVRSL